MIKTVKEYCPHLSFYDFKWMLSEGREVTINTDLIELSRQIEREYFDTHETEVVKTYVFGIFKRKSVEFEAVSVGKLTLWRHVFSSGKELWTKESLDDLQNIED